MFNIAVLSLFLVLYLPWSFGISIEQITEPYGKLNSLKWNDKTKILYFVDTLSGSIHRLDIRNNITNSIQSPEKEVSSINLIEGKKQEFIVGVNETLYKLNWDEKSNKKFTALGKINNDSSTILSTAIADPEGELLTSTYGLNRINQTPIQKSGALYSIQFQQDKVLQPRKRMSNSSILYGLAFRKGYLYYSDSVTGNVFKAHYNPTRGPNGGLGYEIPLFNLAEHGLKGYAYGMAFDYGNRIWISLYEGSKIIQIGSKSGTLLLQYDLPFRNPTSLAFGGVDDRTTLYVGSSRISAFQQQLGEGAGAVFAIHGLGVIGAQVHEIKISE